MVTLSDTDSAASIYYTTNGSTPTASSTPYTGPIAVPTSTTIKAVAIDSALANSNVAAAAYVIQPGISSINFGSGFSSVAGLTLNGSATNTDDSRLQLTTAATYQAGSVFWNQPIGVQTFTTDFLFQLSSAQGDGFTFTIQNVGVKALGASGSGLGYQNIAKSVAIKFDLYSNAGEGTDSTGVYTNGAAPTVPAVDMTSSGVVVRSGDSIQAHITYDGTTLSMTLLDLVTNKTFVLKQAINIPQIVGANTAYVGFTGSTGGLTASQKILTWTYATQAPSPATASPVFSPQGGNFTTSQNVTLSDSTAGAVIYYTTNGSTPTTSSAVYSGAIPVGMGTTTIEAMAVASGALAERRGDGDLCCVAGGDGGSDLQPGSWDLQHSAKRNALRQHCRRSDLLHDERHSADDLLFRLYGSDRSGYGYDDGQSDGGGEWGIAERCGDGDLCCFARSDGDADL